MENYIDPGLYINLEEKEQASNEDIIKYKRMIHSRQIIPEHVSLVEDHGKAVSLSQYFNIMEERGKIPTDYNSRIIFSDRMPNILLCNKLISNTERKASIVHSLINQQNEIKREKENLETKAKFESLDVKFID